MSTSIALAITSIQDTVTSLFNALATMSRLRLYWGNAQLAYFGIRITPCVNHLKRCLAMKVWNWTILVNKMSNMRLSGTKNLCEFVWPFPLLEFQIIASISGCMLINARVAADPTILAMWAFLSQLVVKRDSDLMDRLVFKTALVLTLVRHQRI